MDFNQAQELIRILHEFSVAPICYSIILGSGLIAIAILKK